MSSLRRALLPALALTLSPLARAQFVVFDLAGGAAGDLFGNALAGGLDVDGDGVPDLVIGARRADLAALNGGRVEVRSGASGAPLLGVDGAGAGDSLGQAVGLVGDLDGDGRAEFVVGAPFGDDGAWNGGGASVLTGAAGATLFAVPGQVQFGLLGWSVAGCGDVDLDGVNDFVIGAPEEDGGGTDSGALYVHSGATGSFLWGKIGQADGDRLGRAVAGAGDLDGDGHADVLGGADQEDVGALEDAGVVRAWSGRDGALIWARSGPTAGARLGFAVAGVGDVDGDGRDDFAAGAFGEGPNGAQSGRVYVWSGASGALLHTFAGAAAGDQLGWAVAGLGDVDGDGRADILVGAPGELGGRGAARIYSGASGALLFVTHGAAPGDRLGESVTGMGDLDGDGIPEWAAGAPFADAAGADAGRVLVLSTQNPAGQPFCFGDGSGGACPCGNFGAPGRGCQNSSAPGAELGGQGFPSVSADLVTFHAAALPPSQPVLLFAGLNAVNSGLGVPFGDGLRCAGGGLRRLGVRVAIGGAATWGPGLFTPQGWQAGDVRRLQAWYRDPIASPCGAGFNLSNGFRISLVP